MDTRRVFFGLAFSAATTLVMRQTGSAKPAKGKQPGQAMQGDILQARGAPTGRIGAATRGARDVDGGLAIELVAPLRGVGLTSVNQPELCYVLSGSNVRPLRLTISTPGLARPLANFKLPSTPPSGFGIVHLRDHGIRLTPNQLCIWSLTLMLDPRAPSQDLVGSALIQYRPANSAFQAADRQTPLASRIAALGRAGYWYDAVTLAEQNQATDNGTALASLFKQADLSMAASSGFSSVQQ